MKNEFLFLKPKRYEEFPSAQEVFKFFLKKNVENPIFLRFYCIPEFTKSQYLIKTLDKNEKTPNLLFFFVRSFQKEFVTIKFKQKKTSSVVKEKIYLSEKGSFKKSNLIEYDPHNLDSYGEHQCGIPCFLKEKSKLYHSMKTYS